MALRAVPFYSVLFNGTSCYSMALRAVPYALQYSTLFHLTCSILQYTIELLSFIDVAMEPVELVAATVAAELNPMLPVLFFNYFF